MSAPEPGCRVLHLGHSIRVGGKERVLLGLAQAGRAAGHDDRVLVFDHAPGGEAAELDPGDVPVDFLGRGRGLDLRFVRRLSRYLEASDPKVVHAHNDSALVYAVLATALIKKPRPAVIATMHNAPSHPTAGARRSTRWCAGRARGVACVSEELREYLVAEGWLKQAHVIPNGVDLAHFCPEGPVRDLRAELGLPEAARLVGMPARFDRGKRFEDLDAALAVMDGPWVGLAIGEGPEHARVAALPNLRLLPPTQDMPALLRGLDAVFLGSDHEGQPMVILEAMACGTPVLASPVGGLPALLGTPPNHRGLLIPNATPTALATALTSLPPQPLTQPLTQPALHHIHHHHSLPQTLHLYEQMGSGTFFRSS